MLAISSVKHIHVLELPCPSSKITQDVAACKLSERNLYIIFRIHDPARSKEKMSKYLSMGILVMATSVAV
jgi:hypothetical protein